MNLLRIAALLGGAAAASPWNFGQGSSNAATRAALESFQSDGFGMFIHNGPVTQWGTDIGWPLVCTTLPCTVPGPKNVPRNLTTTDELAAHRREYFDLAKTWNPKDFNATALATRAKDAGMKYVVYTTVHCDGFANWPSKVATYNVGILLAPLGPQRWGCRRPCLLLPPIATEDLDFHLASNATVLPLLRRTVDCLPVLVDCERRSQRRAAPGAKCQR